MVGDGEADILRARHAGIRSIWLHRGRTWPRSTCPTTPPTASLRRSPCWTRRLTGRLDPARATSTKPTSSMRQTLQRSGRCSGGAGRTRAADISGWRPGELGAMSRPRSARRCWLQAVALLGRAPRRPLCRELIHQRLHPLSRRAHPVGIRKRASVNVPTIVLSSSRARRSLVTGESTISRRTADVGGAADDESCPTKRPILAVRCRRLRTAGHRVPAVAGTI